MVVAIFIVLAGIIVLNEIHEALTPKKPKRRVRQDMTGVRNIALMKEVQKDLNKDRY